MKAMRPSTLLLFLSTLLLAAWALQWLIIDWLGGPGEPGATALMLVVMFTPAIWSIAYLTVFNRRAWRAVPMRPGNPLWILLAALAPAALGFAVVAAALGASIAEAGFFNFSVKGAQVIDGPWLLGEGQQGWAFFGLNVALTALVYAAISSLAAVGEEFGWRGVVQQHLISNLGLIGGVSVLGLVWAFWHLPLLLAGYNYPDYPVIGGLVLMPATLVGGSFILAWLTIESRSLWPAVVFHGSINAVFQGVVNDLEMVEGVSRLWLDAGWGAGYLALGIALIVLVRRRHGGNAGSVSHSAERRA